MTKSDFAKFKSRSKNRINDILDAASKLDPKKYTDPDAGQYWKLTVDEKTGNGQAIIRFLDNGDTPFVKIFSHWFKSPTTGVTYKQNNLNTIGQPDPVSEYIARLWASEDEENIELAKKIKKTSTLVSNILVVNDPAVPENNGKVFKYRYGTQIFDCIKGKLEPQFEGDEPIDVFSFDEGCNFRLRATKIGGDRTYRSYTTSTFDNPSPIPEEDQERIFNELHDLQALIAPDQFLSYDELKAKLAHAMGWADADNPPLPSDGEVVSFPASRTTVQQQSAKAPVVEDETDTSDDSGIDDDELAALMSELDD